MDMPQAGDGSRAGYSIRVVSRLTGISSDTLRMWERRYGFPKPDRNAIGVRVYAQEHVERLLLVARALKAGYRAGEVIHRSRDDLGDLLATAAGTSLETSSTPASVQAMIAALERTDMDAVRVQLRSAVAALGPKGFLSEVAGPLVEHVGEAWATRRLDVLHEHLLSEALETQIKLLTAAYEGTTRGPVVLLATLPGELHGLGLQMAALYLAISGMTPRVLGVDTPPDQIVAAARSLGARAVGISVSAGSDLAAAATHVSWLLQELGEHVEVWAGGKRARNLNVTSPRFFRVATWPDLDARLERMLPPSSSPPPSS
jgi:DNA-binding transcriptional MerR regulator/methylmalonyl-CoA mutase cobalamin-binding subunit